MRLSGGELFPRLSSCFSHLVLLKSLLHYPIQVVQVSIYSAPFSSIVHTSIPSRSEHFAVHNLFTMLVPASEVTASLTKWFHVEIADTRVLTETNEACYQSDESEASHQLPSSSSHHGFHRTHVRIVQNAFFHRS